MSTPTEYKTEKGTVLPLINLKGKPYLAVAHRLVWLTEKYSRYTIATSFIECNENYAIARSEITIFDDEGFSVKSATATKKETKSDFPDFVEKAETGATGRALALLGMGTQFCTQDLDEGNRLADAPIPVAKRTTTVATKAALEPATEPASLGEQVAKPRNTFNKNKTVAKLDKVAETTTVKEEVVDGWE